MAFSPIRSGTDTSIYAGAVVAYTSSSSYFGEGFGFISEETSTWHETEEGHYLCKLLNMDEEMAPSMRALIGSRLSEAGLSMRFATDAELQFVVENITADTAYFEFMTNKQKMLGILERQLRHVPIQQ